MIIISANKKRMKIYALILLTGFILPMLVYSLKAEVYNPCSLIIIIDDFGNKSPALNDFLNLEAKFTGAVMPCLEHTEHDMNALREHNKDIILHMPMESHTGKQSWLGPNALTSNLSDQELEKNICDSLDQVKYAIGLNNHMGSKATEDDRILNILFKIAKARNLIIIDSRTTSKSKLKNFAEQHEVKFLSRDVFIDSYNTEQVCKNLRKAIKIASKRKSYAIAIGHVAPPGGKITADAIKQIYQEYKDTPVKFINLSELNLD